MAEAIQSVFILPPIAIARLGGSTSPQAAYRWVEAPNPHSKGETTIEPDWSLVVQSDGTVQPVMPESLSFREGALIRPVCPFFELWASVGESGSDPTAWRDVPVTPALLAKHGASLGHLALTVDAKNFKVSRRTGNAALRYGTFPPLRLTADTHASTAILATSPPDVPVSRRMIPADRPIPLGSFQVMKSRPQPAPDPSQGWSSLVNGQPLVNVEVLRFRFTPARGHVYGPPASADPQTLPSGRFAPVEPGRNFLNRNAGWAGVNVATDNGAPDFPQDTYDGADVGSNRSLGVVDDTCEARIAISLTLPAPANTVLTAAATVFVGPPDFAPDRRPFLSLADELNDRSGDSAARTAQLSDSDRDAWVEDLFERIYETLSLFNLDLWRRAKALRLTGDRLAPPIEHDRTRDPSRAMSATDRLRNRSFALPADSPDIRLPLTEHARMRHRALSDLQALRDFIAQNPGRLRTLIRRPFEAERGEINTDGNVIGYTTMRMPPFMRNSNSGPLTLAAWQYDLVMAWVEAVESLPAPRARVDGAARRMPRPMSPAAAARRDEVLARLARTGRGTASGGQG
jgi:hypothetical protein